MFKKFLPILMIVTLVFVFIGCGDMGGVDGNGNGGGGGGGNVWPPVGMTDLDIEDVDGLQDAGDPVVRRAGNYLFVTDRGESWYGIDTQLEGLLVDSYYTVTVTGRAGVGTMELQRPFDGPPWNFQLDSYVVATAGGTFTLTAEVPGSSINGSAFSGDGGSSEEGRLRVVSGANVDFLIESFVLIPLLTGDEVVLLPLPTP